MPRTDRRKVRISASVSRVVWDMSRELAAKLGISYSDLVEQGLIRILESYNMITERVHS